MDEKDKQILHEYMDKHFGERLDAQRKMIAGLQLILVIVVMRLHKAGVSPAQKIHDEIKELSELWSIDPDNRELVRMGHDIIRTIDMALGEA